MQDDELTLPCSILFIGSSFNEPVSGCEQTKGGFSRMHADLRKEYAHSEGFPPLGRQAVLAISWRRALGTVVPISPQCDVEI
jgi:hypothetical protein